MTFEELKEEANGQGYNLIKKRDYDCSCWCGYPNPLCKRKSGKWKCIESFKCINPEEKHKKTKCVRIIPATI